MTGPTPRPDRRLFLLGGLSLAGLAACGAPQPVETARPAATRDIPFALWAGDPDARAVKPVRVRRGDVEISGPSPWVHPVTGATVQVWERRNEDAGGVKRTLFTVRPDRQALSRVFDSRPGRSDRVFDGDAFFPLGPWREDEARDFPMTEYRDGRALPHVATLRIVRIDHTFRDVPGSLRFDWTLRDAAGQTVFDERFDYSPGVGLARFTDKLK